MARLTTRWCEGVVPAISVVAHGGPTGLDGADEFTNSGGAAGTGSRATVTGGAAMVRRGSGGDGTAVQICEDDGGAKVEMFSGELTVAAVVRTKRCSGARRRDGVMVMQWWPAR
ncbi:hypothetical protein DEO72_LG8g1942 [Vigna unguiculata]|uniref:Uncharacterized protein n=1 Tax=Vigna unguiculata TaxID=3917 RepID=A0A4D6MTG0_VIGUN|nr:hypothetical protein DEO72_LG8g1942 [Vigna unguiculata]